MDQDSQEVTKLAVFLISKEAESAGKSDELLSSVEPTFERLKIHLSGRLGKGGYRALLKRAVTLSIVDYPWLECLTISDDGTLSGMDLAPSSLSVSQTAAGGIAILARLIGLLDTFIGRSLCLRVLQSGWPSLTNFYTDSSQGDSHE